MSSHRRSLSIHVNGDDMNDGAHHQRVQERHVDDVPRGEQALPYRKVGNVDGGFEVGIDLSRRPAVALVPSGRRYAPLELHQRLPRRTTNLMAHDTGCARSVTKRQTRPPTEPIGRVASS